MIPQVYMNDFKLPVEIEKDSEYLSRVCFELDRYNDFIANNFPDLKALIKNISCNIKSVKEALNNYLNGKLYTAHALIRSYIEQVKDSPFFNAVIDENYAFRGFSVPALRPSFYAKDEYYAMCYEHMMKKELSFFRARLSESHLKREDMLHIPFDKREIVKNFRFSVTGLPCCYLSTTSWGSWIEMGKPSRRKFNVSAFKLPKNLRVLNLCVQQYLIDGMSAMPSPEEYQRIIYMLEIFPLVIATSFRVTRQKEREFKSEYVISQIIMQVCCELGIDGVAYLSRRTDDMIAYPYAVNLALLMTGDEKSKYWSRADEVELTEPFRFSDFMKLPEHERNISGHEEYKSFVNDIYAKGRKGGHGMITFRHKRVPYIDTCFSAFDEYLLGREFRNFESASA